MCMYNGWNVCYDVEAGTFIGEMIYGFPWFTAHQHFILHKNPNKDIRDTLFSTFNRLVFYWIFLTLPWVKTGKRKYVSIQQAWLHVPGQSTIQCNQITFCCCMCYWSLYPCNTPKYKLKDALVNCLFSLLE